VTKIYEDQMIAGQVLDIARKLVGNNKIIKTWDVYLISNQIQIY